MPDIWRGHQEEVQTVVVGQGATSIGNWAFYGCTSLKDVYYSGTEEQWAQIDIDGDYNANDALRNAKIHYNGTTPAPAAFTDVQPNAYYADPVAWAVTNGITQGLTDTLFGPNGPCTRGQIVTFLYRDRNKT